MDTSPTCLLRREYDPAALLAAHPPVLRHPHKRLLFDLACPPGSVHIGPIILTRWAAAALPSVVELAPTEMRAVPGYYDYEGEQEGVWHVNFADPQLFVAYGSPLLAQDELQAVEHPLLGCLREALLSEGQPALTEENLVATPVLVTGVERRCTLDTAPNFEARRLYGLYGRRFASATEELIRGALHVHQSPRRSNLIAMAAPAGGRGPYFHTQIERILVTAYTAFVAAVSESHCMWPHVPVEVRTGFWGCGAFGGNRRAMTLLQLLAAKLARVDRVRFHVFDDAGNLDFQRGASDLHEVVSAGSNGEPLGHLLERVDDLDYEWGESDGN
jgi:Poly (ADP-ribose) glycohydrolase (PARG), Macro domain fold